jgi:hypothetical protein
MYMKYFILFLFVLPFDLLAQKEFTLEGTMMHTDLEGGCWYLQTKRGQKYELVGSEENLQKVRVEGRYATLSVKQAKMMASICMMGTIVEIIAVLDTNRYPRDPAIATGRIRGVVSKTNDGFWYIMGSDGKKYEMEKSTVRSYYKTGLSFNRQVKMISGTEGALDMDMVIVAVIRPEEQIKPKYNDPR